MDTIETKAVLEVRGSPEAGSSIIWVPRQDRINQLKAAEQPNVGMMRPLTETELERLAVVQMLPDGEGIRGVGFCGFHYWRVVTDD